MIKEEDVKLIKDTLDESWFDSDALIVYLNTHEIVSNDVFKTVVIDQDSMPARLLKDLRDKYGFNPVPVKTFLRRLPFYFYYPRDDEKRITHAWLGAIIRRIEVRKELSDEAYAEELEKRYQALEEIHYHFHISVEDIFGYMDIRGHRLNTDQFMEWYDYLKICEEIHWYDYMPDNFVYKYNLALEAAGRKPVIYELHEVLPGEYCFRDGNIMEIQGDFPVDPAGNPVIRWVGIILKNAGEIRAHVQKGKHVAWKIEITLTPRTELYARNLYNDESEDESWYRLYAGPQIMEFDYTVLKDRRQKLKMTQKEVAEAIGATLRTYQKWETGETTPDSKFLLRLLNWLDIRDVVDATKWNDEWDS